MPIELSLSKTSVQRTALQKIAARRQVGVLRSELARMLSMDPKSFHYIATVSLTSQAAYQGQVGHFLSLIEVLTMSTQYC